MKHYIKLSLSLSAFLGIAIYVIGIHNVNADTRAPSLSSDLLVSKYLELAQLSPEKKSKAIETLGNHLRSQIFRFHMAFQIAKTPSLSRDQRDLLLEGIRNLREDVYSDVSERNKAGDFELKFRSLFSEREAFEYLSYISVKPDDSVLLEKYLQVAKLESDSARNKMFREAASTLKQGIWKIRMVEHLAVEDFSKAQQDLILIGIEKLSDSKLYIPSYRDDTERVAGEFEASANKIFSKKDFYRLFVSLSGNTSCAIPESTGKDAVQAAGEEVGGCSCTATAWCQFVYGGLTYCHAAGCEETTSGCGVWGTSACVGYCKVPNPV